MGTPTPDWSSMHTSILGTIFEFLTDSEADLRRVAAVCTYWRFSISLMPAARNPFFNLTDIGLKLPDIGQFSCSIKKYALYIVSSNEPCFDSSRVWLIQVQKPEPNKWVLYNPFTSLLSSRKFTLNLLGNFRILHTANWHQLHLKLPSICFRQLIENPKKVILISKFALVLFKSGRLSIMYEGERIDFETTIYMDIASFRDEFYAIDVNGLLVKIEIARGDNTKPEFIPISITKARFRLYYARYLVTSRGDLYMIIKDHDDDCRAYVLNKQKWIPVNSLKNMVFFLLEGGANFSVSAIDLGWNRGNFIYLLHHCIGEEIFMQKRKLVRVYDLNNSKITTDLKDFPRPVFWPPPNWVKLVLPDRG